MDFKCKDHQIELMDDLDTVFMRTFGDAEYNINNINVSNVFLSMIIIFNNIIFIKLLRH